MKDLEGQIDTASKGRDEAIKQLRKLQVRGEGLEDIQIQFLHNIASTLYNFIVEFIAAYLILLEFSFQVFNLDTPELFFYRP